MLQVTTFNSLQKLVLYSMLKFAVYFIQKQSFLYSNPDLSKFEVSETDEVLRETENERGHLFPLALSTRNQKGKGAVQKRVSSFSRFFIFLATSLLI